MSDLRLFRVLPSGVVELTGTSASVERSLHALVERNLEALLGVHLVASDHPTGRSHGGRVDTLGLDENGCPVIVEYKRTLNENVINQGLFYLDWLLDHRAEFALLVTERLGKVAAARIEWTAPRLVCIAGGFTRYDAHAIKQIDRTIELIRYRRFGDDFLVLELVGSAAAIAEPATRTAGTATAATRRRPRRGARAIADRLAASPADVRDRYEALASFLLALGDDVQARTLTTYVAYRRLTNFACVDIHPQLKRLVVYAKVDPDGIALAPGFTRDVRAVGDPGTGDLEMTINGDEDLERAKPLLLRSYEAS